jgi:hypothetical protein
MPKPPIQPLSPDTSCTLDLEMGRSCTLDLEMGRSCTLDLEMGRSCTLDFEMGRSCTLDSAPPLPVECSLSALTPADPRGRSWALDVKVECAEVAVGCGSERTPRRDRAIGSEPSNQTRERSRSIDPPTT